MTTIVISQPMYFPWAGFLDLVRRADVLIWLDDAQFSKGSFTNRVQVKLPSGTPWMTVPLMSKGKGKPISELRAQGTNWIASHRAMLRQSFVGDAQSAMALEIFDTATASVKDADDLPQALIRSTETVLQAIGCDLPQSLMASEMGVPGRSWQRVLDLVRAAGGTRYYSAAGGAGYINHDAFDAAGVAISYINYAFNAWPQSHGDFTPYVTGLDLVAGAGQEGHRHLAGQMVPWIDYLELKGHAST